MIISIPQECLVAECGGDVRIYKSDGVYSFHCIFANHAISFELKEKGALKLAELMKKEQPLNSEQQSQNSDCFETQLIINRGRAVIDR